VPNNLGQVIRCESRVNTRLRYALKSEGTYGSPSRVVTLQMSSERYEYVVNAITDLNALNGVLQTNDSVSGVDSPQYEEGKYVVKET
jgi:hypothetical protein